VPVAAFPPKTLLAASRHPRVECRAVRGGQGCRQGEEFQCPFSSFLQSRFSQEGVTLGFIVEPSEEVTAAAKEKSAPL